MPVTVAICTWNRAKLLDRTLAEMRRLLIPSGVEWELLVVNNSCADDTDAVIDRHSHDLPIRRLFEPKQGLSNARNCAVAAARGELIVFTDDDILVDPAWLSAYVEASGRWPDALYFGGAITPWFEVTPPTWVSENYAILGGLLGIRDLGAEERPFDDRAEPYQDEPYGANMAYRRGVFDGLSFDAKFGKSGTEHTLGEESSFVWRLRARGAEGIWVPGAKIRHFVQRSQLSRAYVGRYFRGYGRTSVRMKGRPEGEPLWGAPRWLYRRYGEHMLRYLARRFARGHRWLDSYVEMAITAGMIAECRSTPPPSGRPGGSPVARRPDHLEVA